MEKPWYVSFVRDHRVGSAAKNVFGPGIQIFTAQRTFSAALAPGGISEGLFEKLGTGARLLRAVFILCVFGNIVFGSSVVLAAEGVGNVTDAPAVSVGAITPTPIPSSSSAQEAVDLSAPAFDLEWVADKRVGSNSSSESGQPRQIVKVGDKLQLKISGFHPPQGPLDLSLLAGSQEQKDSQEQDWNTELNPRDVNSPNSDYFISATPLKPGQLTLPSLVLKDSSGKAVARTNPFNIEVASAIKPTDPQPEEPNALEPPVALQFPWWIIVSAAFLGLVALGFAFYGIYRWWRKKKPLGAKRGQRNLPEDEVALTKLAELERQEFLKQGKFKSYYFKISEILKVYVGARYGFDAPESTTREMIAILKQKELTLNSSIEGFQNLFEKLDRVKFTDHVPETDESTQLIQNAKEFIMNTRRSTAIANPIGVGSSAIQ